MYHYQVHVITILAVVETQNSPHPERPAAVEAVSVSTPIQTRGRLIAQSPVGAYLYAFMDVKHESKQELSDAGEITKAKPTTQGSEQKPEEQPTTTVTAGEVTKENPLESDLEFDNIDDSALEDTEDEKHDIELDQSILGSPTETPPPQDQRQKRELKRHLTDDFDAAPRVDLLGYLEQEKPLEADLSARKSDINPAPGYSTQDESQIPRNVALFPAETEIAKNRRNDALDTNCQEESGASGTKTPPNTRCLGGFVVDISEPTQLTMNTTGSTPKPKGTCLGEFIADSNGTRLLEANSGGATTLSEAVPIKANPKRLTKKQREALENAGVTPPLKTTRRAVAKRPLGPPDNANPEEKRVRTTQKPPKEKKPTPPKTGNTPPKPKPKRQRKSRSKKKPRPFRKHQHSLETADQQNSPGRDYIL